MAGRSCAARCQHRKRFYSLLSDPVAIPLVKGMLWRYNKPALSDEDLERLVHVLIDALRAVKDAIASSVVDQLRAPHAEVDQAKVEMEERGGLVKR